MGLEHNKELLHTLTAMSDSGRMPHAILFEGEAGIGKKTAAILTAKMMLCDADSQKPCGECPHCLKLEKEIHPDLRFFAPPADKKEFTIDIVRQIRQEAYIAPNEGRFKIYVLDKAHEMNAQAQNALLKTLEEPPEHARFLLLCENRSRMLETILSRVTCFSLTRPTPEQCAETLSRLRPQSDEDKRAASAIAADGNIGRALEILDSTDGGGLVHDAAALMDKLLLRPRYEALCLMAGYERNRKGLCELFSLTSRLMADTCAKRYRGGELGAYARFTAVQLMQAAEFVDKATRRVQANGPIPLLCACLTHNIKSMLDA